MRQPDIAANHGVVPDFRVSTENGRTGIDNYAIAYVRVAFDAFHQLPVFILCEGKRTERYTLIQLHARPDDARFADDDARSMVDEETRSDRCARMNVDSRP